jgi:hypothetical protein
MVYTSHRHQLAHVAAGGRFPFFTKWLRRWWEHQHTRSQLDPMEHADYALTTLALTDVQVDALWARGIIPPPGAPSGELQPFPRSTQATELIIPNGVRVIHDPVFEHTLYQLADGQVLRLRLGELERLVDTGYPITADGVLDVLWREIAPLSIEPYDGVAHRLRAISAVLHANNGLEPADVLDRLRTLVLPPSSGDLLLVWLLAIEHRLMAIVTEMMGDSDQARLIRLWRLAQSNLVLWNIPDIHSQIDQTARMFAPSVADDPRQLRRIKAVRDVIAAALAALAPEGVGGDEDDPLFDASDLSIAVEQLQRVMAAR